MAATRERRAVDHVTARRLAIWLARMPQRRPFAEGLGHFIDSGAITPAFKAQLRRHSRSGSPYRPQAEKLMEYVLGRGRELGPLSERFGAACDQLDRAEAMLVTAVERTQQGIRQPEPTWPERDGPPVIALAHRELESGMISLVMDPSTANIAMFAIASLAIEREAHSRELAAAADRLPEGTYGQANRGAMAAREARIAARLRDVQRAYLAAIEETAVLVPPRAGPEREVGRRAILEREPEAE